MEKHLLGFDIGGTKCAAILGKVSINNQFQILGKRVFSTSSAPTPELCISRFISEAEDMMSALPGIMPEAIGISCGGPLDSSRGIIMSPPNLPGWDDVPICEIIARHFHLPVKLCNDADACALAEWRFGAGRGTQNMAFLTFGTGLGAGLILQGKLYSGACGMAGECGHIRLANDGPVGYGKRGSFEGFCSGGGIAQLGQAYAARHIPLPWCKSHAEIASITAKDIANAANAGDASARAIFEESGRRLGAGLSILIDLLNLERIVIGSIFQRCEHLLRPTMEETLKQEALPQSLAKCSIVPAELGENIGDVAALSVGIL
ncbi:MAG: ROK family protein [Victivallales bacterium]|nr:ROK family protein [Victivallales bacterium]